MFETTPTTLKPHYCFALHHQIFSAPYNNNINASNRQFIILFRQNWEFHTKSLILIATTRHFTLNNRSFIATTGYFTLYDRYF